MRKSRLMRWISRTQNRKALRAAAEEARREDRLMDEMKVVNRWAKTKDPKAVTYLGQLHEEQMKMHRRTTEERCAENEDWWDDDREASQACDYRTKWKSVHTLYCGSYEDTSKYP
jgi:hypothetical protein